MIARNQIAIAFNVVYYTDHFKIILSVVITNDFSCAFNCAKHLFTETFVDDDAFVFAGGAVWVGGSLYGACGSDWSGSCASCGYWGSPPLRLSLVMSMTLSPLLESFLSAR